MILWKRMRTRTATNTPNPKLTLRLGHSPRGAASQTPGRFVSTSLPLPLSKRHNFGCGRGRCLHYRFAVNSFEQSGDYLFVAARTTEGTPIEPEIAARFFSPDAIDAQPCHTGNRYRATTQGNPTKHPGTQRLISTARRYSPLVALPQ
jgi:hypothetical protein